VKAVIQRVNEASVVVDSVTVGSIGPGTLVLLAVEKGDRESDAQWLAKKIVELRMFADFAGKMNLSLKEINGSILAISQFTLVGSCEKGRRPSFTTAAAPDEGKRLYEEFVRQVKTREFPDPTGIFQEDWRVNLTKDGPVTFILESRQGRNQ